jgi:hypothetical protein
MGLDLIDALHVPISVRLSLPGFAHVVEARQIIGDVVV